MHVWWRAGPISINADRGKNGARSTKTIQDGINWGGKSSGPKTHEPSARSSMPIAQMGWPIVGHYSIGGSGGRTIELGETESPVSWT